MSDKSMWPGLIMCGRYHENKVLYVPILKDLATWMSGGHRTASGTSKLCPIHGKNYRPLITI